MMARRSQKKIEVQLLKWPKVIVAVLMIVSMIFGGGATLASQMARINNLEQQIERVENNSFSKDQAALIKQLLSNIDKRLDKIEKKLGI